MHSPPLSGNYPTYVGVVAGPPPLSGNYPTYIGGVAGLPPLSGNYPTYVGCYRLSTQVSLLPPPCDELTTSEPRRKATRVNPPGRMEMRDP